MTHFTSGKRSAQTIVASAGLLVLSSAAHAVLPATQQAQQPAEPPVTQLIVKFKPAGGVLPAGASVEAVTQAYAMTPTRLQNLSADAGIPLTYKRAMSGNAQVVKLPYAMAEQQAEVIAEQLRQSADVEYAEPDRWMFPMSVTSPNDTYYANEWHLAAPTVDLGAADVAPVWSTTAGSSGIVVGIVDTGVLNHTDLQANLVGGSASASGYDMITDSSAAYSGAIGSNDGDGRDSDPTDPGDWTSADLCYAGWGARNSSWHGTHVAGIIGAVGDNSLGVTGVNQTVKLMMVRALGTCGGLMSDVADGVEWASGGTVSGVTSTSTPAKVINLSLGAGPGTPIPYCSTTMQTAINDAVSRGTTIVVAAGNSQMDPAYFEPASCNNVITVAALGRTGARAYYSNYDTPSTAGNYVSIAAPGGDQSSATADGILSTLDTGTTTAANDNVYVYYQGTSMATPVVSGVVALMLAANSHLTDGSVARSTVPALIKSKLQTTARAFPTGTGRDCNTAICGAGIIDAVAAVAAVTTAPSANAGADQLAVTNSAVYLSGYGSHDDGSITAYHWTQTAGTPVTLHNASTPTPYFAAPNAVETLTFQLTVTDDVGLTSTSTMNVTTYAPVSSGGGGSFGWLGLSTLAVLVTTRRRKKMQ